MNTTGVAVFSPDALSWKSYSNAASAALGKYMDWTREDFETFFADSANEAEFEDAWKFLSQTGNDHLQGAAISDEEALSILQGQFDSLFSRYNFSNTKFPAFPCEGIEFSGLSIYYVDFSDCTGITGEHLAATSMLTGCKFNPVDFTGVDLSKCYFYDIDLSEASGLTAAQLSSMDNFTECKLPSIDLSAADFTGKALWGVDFSKCTGLTWGQLASASDMTYTTLPVMNLSGVDTTGKDLSGVDFSNCTGLTTAHLSNASNIDRIIISSSQYETMKADLSGTYISIGNGRYQKLGN